MLTTLSTLNLCPQAPHTDFPTPSDVPSNQQLSFIFGYTKAGNYLTVWKRTNPGKPVLIRISYGYGLLFNKELVHGGGIEMSEQYEDVYINPDLGFPQGRIYAVKDNSKFPLNFICYADPDNNLDHCNSKYVSGTDTSYTNGIAFLQKKETVAKREKINKGHFEGEL